MNLTPEQKEVLSEEEQVIANDIIIESKKQVADFERFLTKQYIEFDYKINKCLYNFCYNDIFIKLPEKKQCI